MLAAHPAGTGGDAFWLVGGRLVDWGPLPSDSEELEQRTAAALRRGGRAGELGAHVPPAEIDEVRIVATYLSGHPETPKLTLDPPPERAALAGFVAQLTLDPPPEHAALAGFAAAQANGSSTTSASQIRTDPNLSPGRRLAPDQRQRDRAKAGGDGRAAQAWPTTRSPNITSSPVRAGADRRSPRSRRLGLPR